jgi:hypothetical protein
VRAASSLARRCSIEGSITSFCIKKWVEIFSA